MHINKGLHDGMAAVIENVFQQAGLGHPSEKGYQQRGLCDLSEYSIPTHLDLGSIEKYLGIYTSHVIENNPLC